MESSSLAGILIEPFLRAFPARKFLLTLRDVYSWCDSWIDHNINSPRERSWRFAAPAKHRVLASLDPGYVQDTAERFCAPLLRQSFADLSPQRSPRA